MGLPPEENSRKPLVHNADMISCKKLNTHLDEPLEEKTRPILRAQGRPGVQERWGGQRAFLTTGSHGRSVIVLVAPSEKQDHIWKNYQSYWHHTKTWQIKINILIMVRAFSTCELIPISHRRISYEPQKEVTYITGTIYEGAVSTLSANEFTASSLYDLEANKHPKIERMSSHLKKWDHPGSTWSHRFDLLQEDSSTSASTSCV